MGSAREIQLDIEKQIRGGQLSGGHRLPSIRAVADQYEVAPGTAAAAFRRLAETGLIVPGRGRQGTRVAHLHEMVDIARNNLHELGDRIDLRDGSPDPCLLPSLDEALQHAVADPASGYASAPVDSGLRLVAERWFQADGIPTQALTVTNGSMDAIERALRSLQLYPGDRIGVEDPGHLPVHQLVRRAGLVPVPIAVDEHGITPDALEAALSRHLSALVVTPRAQNPTGAAFDANRASVASEILADHPDVMVIQDDHAGNVSGADFHQIGVTGASWISVRSAGKSLGPDLRLAVVSGDRTTIDRMTHTMGNGPGWVSYILQRTVAFLLGETAVRDLVDDAALTYERRRLGLLDALRSRGVEAFGRSGFNVWVPVVSEQAAIEELGASGYAVAAGEQWRLESPPAIRISVSRLETTETERLADAVSALRKWPVYRGVQV